MKAFLNQLKNRDEHSLGVQILKYSISGGISTFVHVVCFYSMAVTFFPALSPDDIIARILNLHATIVSDGLRARNSMIDNIVAFVFSNLTAYYINIKWVFKPGRHHPVLEVLYFFLVAGISILIGSAIMGLLIHQCGIATTYAFVVNVLVCLTINFVVRKHVVFKE